MKNKKLLLCAILLFTGCTPKGPDKGWTGVARILPIIVQNSNGETKWSANILETQFENANVFWSETGIQFKMLPPEIEISDEMYAQNGYLEFLSLMSKSKKIAKERDVYPVYFVDSIRWGDKIYGGMSTVANSPLGFQYGTMVSSANRSGITVAHELGHAWALAHTWQDNLDDTPDLGPSDCNDKIHCNIMSYCFPGSDCPPPPFFSPEQISRIRAWALAGSRIHVLETNIAVKQTVLPLLDELEIIPDPVFPNE